METLLKLLDNEAVLGLIVSLAGIIIAKIFTVKPAWQKTLETYKPLLISAIKGAEKLIPDDVENKGLKRLDMALDAAIIAIGDGSVTKDTLRLAITALHAELEANGNLTTTTPKATIDPEILP